MGSGLKQWESDPLFSAAEVVQDSADRMDSVFRLLLHELSLLQDDHPDPKLRTSIDCHRRDLATTLETSKWQLEDFERAVNSSSLSDKSRTREDVISRHRQFVRAIREQIIHVEKRLEDYPVGNAEWVNLNEQDRDGLALFLSGGNPVKHFDRHGSDNNILKRFLDPATAPTSKDNTPEMVDRKRKEIENANTNGAVHTNLRRVGSHYSTRPGFEALGSLPEASSDRHGEDGGWDLEANGAKPRSFSDGYSSRSNIFAFFNNLWNAYGSRVTRTYIKKLKDGEERMHSPSYTDVPHAAQGQRLGVILASGSRSFYGLCNGLLRKTMHQIQACRTRYQRLPYYIQANKRRPIILTLATLCILVTLGKHTIFISDFLNFSFSRIIVCVHSEYILHAVVPKLFKQN